MTGLSQKLKTDRPAFAKPPPLAAIPFEMKILITLYILVALSSCRNLQGADVKTHDLGPFSINLPEGWSSFKANGVDSYVGGIVTRSKDTLEFDFGPYSNDLHESTPFIVDSITYEQWDNKPDQDAGVIVLKSTRLVDPDKFRITRFYYERHGGFLMKFIRPVHSGKGILGVYIDSVKHSNIGTVRFNLYGTDVNPLDEEEAIAAFQTILFN